MYAVKIQKVGESLVITLPEEVLQQLKIGEGDNLFLTETPDGIQLTTCNPQIDKAMKAYRKVSEKYKNALRELAK
ncbi:MAG: AbrB/MazE/SpoVT family DNA-binding domain-containing protein [Microcoleus sp. PH2017_29_MFU_D_A]|jgi:putative addiction module antidote|uniref:AbrB/MazE/SpoVT family DNA-binding domain-containing protein n=1 Tax=unclassified Microcoleus TaxID=2642155 RepID=UPI001DE3ABD3|nr:MULTISPECIES: AbrB/MazE/SpoVT family DNA-binding domain-containing protein [unclassified Microcoleus]MCC3421449.1 AbrB/MazE/SpoVT family DNA-binding domain-containing protein [Microcoleus sp. PH2017_07_MST_O_A]MCC3433599.1 AbrB/MazE/SpoVT family DNA-binding domain-containing protein [Microcoleus sp. PH2017_04_SCI_O_A]MCC3445311.1 AbrB/MazE/SpoVT family DNA-binding domain-containing protein [Microcoleus sp. PH2017_03_ELD_O_A]MCC3470134.1 AbrB/MazE/SpoVT family DNA-binding domain-containing pr